MLSIGGRLCKAYALQQLQLLYLPSRYAVAGSPRARMVLISLWGPQARDLFVYSFVIIKKDWLVVARSQRQLPRPLIVTYRLRYGPLSILPVI